MKVEKKRVLCTSEARPLQNRDEQAQGAELSVMWAFSRVSVCLFVFHCKDVNEAATERKQVTKRDGQEWETKSQKVRRVRVRTFAFSLGCCVQNRL